MRLAWSFYSPGFGCRASGRRLQVVDPGVVEDELVRLEPWDPFARQERSTRSLSVQQLLLEHGGENHPVRVRPYVLPSQVQFSSVEAHGVAAGPRKWNRQQGFYIYRGDRMIQSGGWNRLRTMDEHSKLARLAIDIPAGLDELFQINVAKMRVVIPDELRPQLRALAGGITSYAQEAYRRRLRVVEGGRETDDDLATRAGQAASLGEVWPLIAEVLRHELQGHPDLLDRVLLALANARVEEEPGAVASSATP